ncbi:Cytoplasmic dynein 2 light intermediate chain 1, partial [Blyttiomyces sp. JEL0837]
ARKLLNHFAFKTNPLQELSIDHNKSLVILAGQDSLAQIGVPPSELSEEVIGKQGIARLEQWKQDFDQYFPRKNEDILSYNSDLDKFPESAIDSLRAQKDEEFLKAKQSQRVGSIKDLMYAMGNTQGSGDMGKSYSRSRAAQMGK